MSWLTIGRQVRYHRPPRGHLARCFRAQFDSRRACWGRSRRELAPAVFTRPICTERTRRLQFPHGNSVGSTTSDCMCGHEGGAYHCNEPDPKPAARVRTHKIVGGSDRFLIHGFREEAVMIRDYFWLTDGQFARIRPYLDGHARQATGRRSPGDQRDRACAQVRRSLGRCPGHLRAEEDALQSLCPVGCEGRLERSLSRPRQQRRSTGAGSHRQFRRQSAPLGRRR